MRNSTEFEKNFFCKLHSYTYVGFFSLILNTQVNIMSFVCVEGNIAAGKSELLQYLKGSKNTAIYEEPLEKWRNLRENNLLELAYKEPEKYGPAFQLYVLQTYLDKFMRSGTNAVSIFERSFWSFKSVFLEALKYTGALNQPMYEVFLEWLRTIEGHFLTQPDIIIYVRTSPEIAYDRMKERDRPEERDIDLAYIKKLHDLHERWIQKMIDDRVAKEFNGITGFWLVASGIGVRKTKLIIVNGDIPPDQKEAVFSKCKNLLFTALKLSDAYIESSTDSDSD